MLACCLTASNIAGAKLFCYELYSFAKENNHFVHDGMQDCVLQNLVYASGSLVPRYSLATLPEKEI